MRDVLVSGLIWYAAFATAFIVGLAYLARKDRARFAALYDRIEAQAKVIHQQAGELSAWEEEAREIADESEDPRFEADLLAGHAKENARTAARIVAALEPQLSGCSEVAKSAVLRELQNAWKPDAGEEVA